MNTTKDNLISDIQSNTEFDADNAEIIVTAINRLTDIPDSLDMFVPGQPNFESVREEFEPTLDDTVSFKQIEREFVEITDGNETFNAEVIEDMSRDVLKLTDVPYKHEIFFILDSSLIP